MTKGQRRLSRGHPPDQVGWETADMGKAEAACAPSSPSAFSGAFRASCETTGPTVPRSKLLELKVLRSTRIDSAR
jgi:hypothetical protein